MCARNGTPERPPGVDQLQPCRSAAGLSFPAVKSSPAQSPAKQRFVAWDECGSGGCVCSEVNLQVLFLCSKLTLLGLGGGDDLSFATASGREYCVLYNIAFRENNIGLVDSL